MQRTAWNVGAAVALEKVTDLVEMPLALVWEGMFPVAIFLFFFIDTRSHVAQAGLKLAM